MTEEAFMTLRDVQARTRHSKTTLYEAIRDGKYPKPRKRGKRSLWLKSEIDAALASELAEMESQAGGK